MFEPSSSVDARLTPAETNTYLVGLILCYEDGLPDRRSEPRYETDAPAVAAVVTQHRSPASPVRIVDVGRRGIRLKTAEKLAVNARVHVWTDSVEIIGRILWSEVNSAGLEIEEVRTRPPAA